MKGGIHAGARRKRQAPAIAMARPTNRAVDISLSLALLAFTLPLLLLAALAVRLDSAGPVFARHVCVGRNGRPFAMLTFRILHTDAAARGPIWNNPFWAARRAARVTRVGALLRLTRIDELPRWLNVLRGDIGLIGARPEWLPETRSCDLYDATHRSLRLDLMTLAAMVRGALTGR